MTLRRKRILSVSAIALAALACASAGAYFYATWYPKRLHAVLEGSIYRSGQPYARQLGPVVHKLGIKTLINFRDNETVAANPDCVYERRFAEEHGLKFVNIPMDCPPTEETISPLLKELDDPANYPILMHCAEGIERSGLAAAIYRLERMGWTNDRAVAELLALGVAKKLRSDSKPQKYVDFMRAYKPHYPLARAGGGTPSPEGAR